MRFVPGGAAVIVAAAVSASALSACTGDAVAIVTETPSPTLGASMTPTPTASPTPTPSPSATALTDDELLALMPDGAEREDLAGAIVTAAFFLEQYGPMFQTGDTRVWDALSAGGCEFCSAARTNADAIRDDGATAVGYEIVANRAAIQGSLTDGDAVLVLDVSAMPGETTDASGGTSEVFDGADADVGMWLVRVGAVWRVTAVAFEESTL